MVPDNLQNTQKNTIQERNFTSLQLQKKLLTNYYEFAPNTIVFDSGQFSMRSDYLNFTLDYLLTEKGLPGVVLSDTSPIKNNYYLGKLPSVLRAKICRLGIYHVYQKYVALVRSALEDFYLDSTYIDVIESLMTSVKLLSVKLAKKLQEELKCVVIFDRSIFSTYLYHKTIVKSTNYEDINYVTMFKPKLHFFVKSVTPEDMIYSKGELYDNIQNFNQDLSYKLKQIISKKEKSDIIMLDSTYSKESELFKINKKIIQEHINQKF